MKYDQLMFHIICVENIRHIIMSRTQDCFPEFKFGLEKQCYFLFKCNSAIYYSKVPLLIMYCFFLISIYENRITVIIYPRNLSEISESAFSRHPHLVTMFSIPKEPISKQNKRETEERVEFQVLLK